MRTSPFGSHLFILGPVLHFYRSMVVPPRAYYRPRAPHSRDKLALPTRRQSQVSYLGPRRQLYIGNHAASVSTIILGKRIDRSKDLMAGSRCHESRRAPRPPGGCYCLVWYIFGVASRTFLTGYGCSLFPEGSESSLAAWDLGGGGGVRGRKNIQNVGLSDSLCAAAPCPF